MLRGWKDALLDKYPPKYARTRSEYGARVGVMTCGDFYASLIGAPEGPHSMNEWIRAPEENYALAVNGKVFIDGAGEFTKTREYLLGYYPEDIRLKKIAANCMALAQTGQYNHDRTIRRGDWVTFRTVIARFTESAIAMAFLLSKKYKPYYKWAFRALQDLQLSGGEISRLLLKIAENVGLDDKSFSKLNQCISELCDIFIRELKAQGLSNSDDSFLASHGEEVQSKIEDGFLRSLPTQYDIK